MLARKITRNEGGFYCRFSGRITLANYLLPPILRRPTALEYLMTVYQLRRPLMFAIVCWLCSSATVQAKEGKGIKIHTEMRQAAIDFLASLDDQLREQSTFDFRGPERTDWHFVPKQRAGVSFKEMNLQQRRAAHVLLRSALSDKGYLKATTVMSLEQVLRRLEADRENVEEIRDPEKYWFAIFGDPAKDGSAGGGPWGWRVEGHHLSLNFTSDDGVVVGTAPLFFGSNPSEVRIGPKMGLRVLGREEDLARALMAALTPEQQAKAIISTQAPAEVLTAPGQPIDIGAPAGISAADLTKRQRQLLRQMVTNFLRHLRSTLASKEIHEVEQAGVENIHFAWAGSQERDENHYFRIHGPTFILEYDNARGNHAHLVWHSRDNDFGSAVLHRHYQESPHHHDQP